MQLSDAERRWACRDVRGVEPRAANERIRDDEWANIVSVAAHGARNWGDFWAEVIRIKVDRLANH